jgi:hypothetical protein
VAAVLDLVNTSSSSLGRRLQGLEAWRVSADGASHALTLVLEGLQKQYAEVGRHAHGCCAAGHASGSACAARSRPASARRQPPPPPLGRLAQVLERVERTERQQQLRLAGATASSSPPRSPQPLQRATVEEATSPEPQRMQQQAAGGAGGAYGGRAPSIHSSGSSQQSEGSGGGGSSCSHPSSGTLGEPARKRHAGAHARAAAAAAATEDSDLDLSLGGRRAAGGGRRAAAWLLHLTAQCRADFPGRRLRGSRRHLSASPPCAGFGTPSASLQHALGGEEYQSALRQPAARAALSPSEALSPPAGGAAIRWHDNVSALSALSYESMGRASARVAQVKGAAPADPAVLQFPAGCGAAA